MTDNATEPGQDRHLRRKGAFAPRLRPRKTGGPLIVRHFAPGGTEHGGGIGRLIGYVLSNRGARLRHGIVDTRGPRWRPLPSALRLAAAMGQMAVDRLRSRPVLCQLHVAGRGSTARKTILGIWARGLGLPYVLHLHDYDYEADLSRRPAWQRRVIRHLFRGAAQVIVLGHRDEATVARSLGVSAPRITVLRNCVPAPATGPGLDTVRREPDGIVEILFLGQLGPRKGVPELIAALGDPAMPRTGWRAVLAGDGPVETYRAEIARAGLSDCVTLPGWVDAATAAALRARAHVLVLPSHAEGFAMAVLEGLAQGLAVVTTRVGAHGEVLEHDETCLLLDPGDVPGLARALSRLVIDPDLRVRLGAAGRTLYRSRFGIEDYVRDLERLQVAACPSIARVE